MFNFSKLNNGLGVLTYTNPDTLPVLSLLINTGSKAEVFSGEKPQCGISHALEHMVFKGSSKRNTKQIALDIEQGGSVINAYTSKEFTCYYTKTLLENFDNCFDILKDFIVDASLDADEWAKEREVIIQEIGEYQDNEQDLIYTKADEVCFKNSCLAHPILGTAEILQSLSRQDLKEYLQKNYRSDNMLVNIASPYSHGEIVAMVSKSDLAKLSPLNKDMDKNIINFNYVEAIHIEKPCEEWHILYRFAAPNLYDEHYFALSLGINVLGEGMASRLFQVLREEHGLCYSIYANYSSYAEIGQINIYAATSFKHNLLAQSLILQECQKITKDITQQELDRAKKSMYMGIYARQESVVAKLESASYNLFRHGKIFTVQERLDLIAKVNLEDVKKVLERYLLSGHNLFTLGKT